MQVVGLTNEQEILVVDRQRPFRINEYLVVEDESLGFPKGEVVETQSFNRFLDLNLDKGIIGPETWRALHESTQYDIAQHEVHVAKVRLLERAQIPIRPGTAVREPAFDEVRGFLVKGTPDRAMVLGVIHATDNLSAGMPAELQNRAKLLQDGLVLDQNGVPFLFDPRAMQQYPHIGIFGGSGSGKSFGLRVFLEELMKLRIPTLVLDPHFELTFSDVPAGCPAGYRDIKFEERFKVFQVGQDVGVNFTQLTTRDLQRLLDASSGLSEGMTNAVEALHRSNDSYMTFSTRIDTLVAALEAGDKGVERRQRDPGASGSEREVGADQARVLNEAKGIPLSSVKGIQWRLNRLYRAGLFTNDIKPIEGALKNGQLAVVQGPIWMLNVFSSYVVGTLYRQRREYKDAQFRRESAPYYPPFVVVTDEAHNFAPKGYEAPAKSIIKEIAQEGRKYGVFLVLATQRPTLLDETVTAQLNTKCVFRTVRASDIGTIKEETDLTQEEARRLPFLRSGDSFVSSAIFGRTVPMRFRMAKTSSPHTENPFDELGQQVESEADEFLEIVGPLLTRYGRVTDAMLIDVTRDLARAGHSFTVDALRSRLEALVEAGHVEKTTFLGMSEYRLKNGA
ncbi:MAG TPA: ATP-binding protein [Symbiobacteriaceae bacterium]|nr:ATP-binding protein [Symbiobacteriaceae bacterium]